VQLQLGLVLTQWLHALPPQQDNNVYACGGVFELRHEWLQLGVEPSGCTSHHGVEPRGCTSHHGLNHDHDTRSGCDTWITTGSRPSWSLSYTLLSPRV